MSKYSINAKFSLIISYFQTQISNTNNLTSTVSHYSIDNLKSHNHKSKFIKINKITYCRHLIYNMNEII